VLYYNLPGEGYSVKMRKISVLLLLLTLALGGCAYHQDFVRMPEDPLYNQTVMFNDVGYIPLLRFCDYYDLDYSWDLASQRIELKKGQKSVVLRPDSSFALADGTAITLDHPVKYKDGSAYIPARSAAFLTREIFELEMPALPEKKRRRIKTVVIDPGHGGKDPGAISRYGTREKDIALDISRRLKKHLEKEGLTVYLTRQKDVFIPLYRRARIAESKNADLFISVHANASRYSRAKGFEVYYLSETTDDNARALEAAENASLEFEEEAANGGKNNLHLNPTACDLILSENRRQSKQLAYYMCNITSDELGMKKRGVKKARFVVLKGAMMPAVLVEVGFLTNRREESKLKRTSFRERIAGAISRSIEAYKREYERTDGFSR